MGMARVGEPSMFGGGKALAGREEEGIDGASPLFAPDVNLGEDNC
jgi:hypothetical protein